MPVSDRLVSAEEFERMPDQPGVRLELVKGRVVRMSPPGSRHGGLATRIAILLDQHTREHGLGAVMTPAGFKLAANPDTVREPDVAFVRQSRIPHTGLPDGFWPGPPDLAVEITSPGDRRPEIQAKVDDYLALGVRMVWVVDPKRETVTVHGPDTPTVTLSGEDAIEGGAVIPGFRCAAAQIFGLGK